jgi:hypothetical protein
VYRSMFPPSPDFVPVRPYHASTASFAPYNFFFRYDMFGKLDAASCASAPVREELLASGNSWHFCSWFLKQRGEKGRGLQVSEGGNGALLAVLHLPCGSRGERACEDYWHTRVGRSSDWQFCSCLRQKGGEEYWYRTRSSVHYWQAVTPGTYAPNSSCVCCVHADLPLTCLAAAAGAGTTGIGRGRVYTTDKQ